MPKTANDGADWNVLARYFSVPRAKTAAAKRARAAVSSDHLAGARAMRQAKALAAQHGIEIEREDAGAYWVTHPRFADSEDDPLEGNHFCSDGREVLAAVQAYVEHVRGS